MRKWGAHISVTLTLTLTLTLTPMALALMAGGAMGALMGEAAAEAVAIEEGGIAITKKFHDYEERAIDSGLWGGAKQLPIAPVKYLDNYTAMLNPAMPTFNNKRKGKYQSRHGYVTNSNRRKLRHAPYNTVQAGAYGRMYGAGPSVTLPGLGGGKFTLSHPGELKWMDKAVSATVPDAAAVIATDMLTIPQGTEVGKRIGNKAWIKKLSFKGVLAFDPTTSLVGYQQVILYVILDTQTNKVLTPMLDIFTDTLLYKALHNLNNSARFKVLWKKTVAYNVQAGIVGAGVPMSVPIEFFLDFSKAPIQIDYIGADGVVGERTANNIMMIASGLIAGSAALTGTTRIRYTD